MENAGISKVDGFQALTCLDDGSTELTRHAPLEPGRGEVLVSLRVCGLCGTDLFKLENASQPAGTVLGHELVARVEECGAGVEGFSPGDRVVVAHHVSCGECVYCLSGSETMCEGFRRNRLSPGGFSESIIVEEAAVSLAMRIIPDSVSDETAVFLEPAACVLRGITRSGIIAGGSAVILGGGSMGLLHLLVLKAAIPEVVVGVVEPLEDRRELALSLGADFSCTPETSASSVHGLSEGRGADAVFDTVGGSGALAAGIELGRQGSTVVLFAHASPGELADFELNRLFKEERRLISSYSGSVKEQEIVWEMMLSGDLDPIALVSARVSLENFSQALELVQARGALKVLIEP